MVNTKISYGVRIALKGYTCSMKISYGVRIILKGL